MREGEHPLLNDGCVLAKTTVTPSGGHWYILIKKMYKIHMDTPVGKHS